MTSNLDSSDGLVHRDTSPLDSDPVQSSPLDVQGEITVRDTESEDQLDPHLSIPDSVGPRNAVQSIDDIAYLVRSEHRVQLLVALATGTRSRSELSDLSGVSSSTMRRTLGAFETRNWVRRTDHRYEATKLGAFIASTMTAVIERFETEQKLRDVWGDLPDRVSEFALEPSADTTITVADADDPYAPVNRFESLVTEASRFRSVGYQLALFEPCLDVVFRCIKDGVCVTVVERPSCTDYVVSDHPELCGAAMEQENLTVLEHEDLPPYGVGLFDDRAVISCYDQTCGAVTALIESDVPAAREWSESIYKSYEREARSRSFGPDGQHRDG